MDKKSKILLTFLVLLVFISVGYTFYKTIIMQDFEVINNEENVTQEETNSL